MGQVRNIINIVHINIFVVLMIIIINGNVCGAIPALSLCYRGEGGYSNDDPPMRQVRALINILNRNISSTSDNNNTREWLRTHSCALFDTGGGADIQMTIHPWDKCEL